MLMSILRLCRPFRVPLAACLLASPLAGAAEAPDWQAVLASLQGAGYQSVEELETTADGGFEAEVFDTRQQAFELLLDAAGTIRSQRIEAQASAEERIELAVVLRLFGWLDEQGYRPTWSVSADDGHIEIETEDGEGTSVELDVEPAAETFRVLRARHHVRAAPASD